MYLIIDSKTGDVMGKRHTAVLARRYAHKLDTLYGAVRYKVGRQILKAGDV